MTPSKALRQYGISFGFFEKRSVSSSYNVHEPDIVLGFEYAIEDKSQYDPCSRKVYNVMGECSHESAV